MKLESLKEVHNLSEQLAKLDNLIDHLSRGSAIILQIAGDNPLRLACNEARSDEFIETTLCPLIAGHMTAKRTQIRNELRALGVEPVNPQPSPRADENVVDII
tara:strand:- start:496 stop:804 length:309 start_codon:yes stop_codon:yes gene_type:complete